MRILIDGDGCPVVDVTIAIGKEYGVAVLLFCDTSHCFNQRDCAVITVSQGADSVDFVLVNQVQPGDIIVTQDYGLAAMCLARKGQPIRQDGMLYREENIDSLLFMRHTAKKAHRAGHHLKGPAKRTKAADEAFAKSLRQLLTESL